MGNDLLLDVDRTIDKTDPLQDPVSQCDRTKDGSTVISSSLVPDWIGC